MLVAVLILAWMFSATGPDAVEAATDPTLVATVPSLDLDPRTNGKVIVYNTRPGSMDIYAVDIHGGKPFPIAFGKGDQSLMGVSGD
ncbi:MAG TPA: hypothetical protein VKU87_07470, partial [Thermomicrobiaceae bacterium]|nr:hypothetical protein [Thermomicrobiaceae bacterium]